MRWRRAARPHLRRALLLAAGAGAAAADVDGSASGGQQCSLLHKGRGFGRNLDGQHGPMRYVSSAQDCCAFCHATAGCELCESRRPIACPPLPLPLLPPDPPRPPPATTDPSPLLNPPAPAPPPSGTWNGPPPGNGDCYAKAANATLSGSSPTMISGGTSSSGPPLPPQPPTRIALVSAEPISTTEPTYASWNIDSSCNRGFHHIHFTNPNLLAAAKGLAPSKLRFVSNGLPPDSHAVV